jgi:hypothetical protein
VNHRAIEFSHDQPIYHRFRTEITSHHVAEGTDAAIRALTDIGPATTHGRPKPHGRRMSAAAKAKIAARMKKYWADKRKVKGK